MTTSISLNSKLSEILKAVGLEDTETFIKVLQGIEFLVNLDNQESLVIKDSINEAIKMNAENFINVEESYYDAKKEAVKEVEELKLKKLEEDLPSTVNAVNIFVEDKYAMAIELKDISHKYLELSETAVRYVLKLITATTPDIINKNMGVLSAMKDELVSTNTFRYNPDLRKLGEALAEMLNLTKEALSGEAPEENMVVCGQQDPEEYLKSLHYNELVRLREDRTQLAAKALNHEILMKDTNYAKTASLADSIILDEIFSRPEAPERQPQTGNAPAKPPASWNTGNKKKK